MLYFLNISFIPNAASSNRLLAYYSYFDTLPFKTSVIYLLPDSNGSRINQSYRNINVTYLWRRKINNSIIRFIAFWINLFRVQRLLKKGDVVFTYDINKTTMLISKIKGVKVVSEITEHPSIPDGGGITAISEEQKYVVARRLSALFVISTPLKELFVSKGVSEGKVQIINMTVDLSRFDGLRKDRSKGRYIAYCGNASNNKDGVDKLIKSFALISQDYKDVKLLIMGKAPSKNISEGNLYLAQKLGVQEKVIFTGQIPSSQVPQLLMDATVLALARPDSQQAEYGFPTKLGEYLLTGNPVVVTKVGDIPKFLEDGISAYLSSPSSDVEFASKLSKALCDEQTSLIVGENGKKVALKSFNSIREASKVFNTLSAI